MPLPSALQGDRWTEKTARTMLPLITWCAKNGRTITYGQLDREIVKRGWGHHVIAVQYGYPAGAIGDALIETGEELGENIPLLNALIVNKYTQLPGKGVNYYLKKYYKPDKNINYMTLDERRAVVEEINADIFAYKYWDDLLTKYDLEPITDGIRFTDISDDVVCTPTRGGWSSEGESKEHEVLKEYVAKHPALVGLPLQSKKGLMEYQLASGDKADVVFQSNNSIIGVEVKSIISNGADLNKGIFQAVKYQALLRSEQKAMLTPPTARAILVTEKPLAASLRKLADILGIRVIVHRVNKEE